MYINIHCKQCNHYTHNPLTNLPLDKMATNFPYNIFKYILAYVNFWYFDSTFTEFCSLGSIS